MKTTDVKVVRHQRSFAEFTCACPNQRQRAIFRYVRLGSWSKIPVLLVVTKHQLWFCFCKLHPILLFFLHQRLRIASQSPAVYPCPTRPPQTTPPASGPLAPSLRLAQKLLHQSPVRKSPHLLEHQEKQRRKRKRTAWQRSRSGRSFYVPPYDPCPLSAGTVGAQAKIQQGRQRLVNAGNLYH